MDLKLKRRTYTQNSTIGELTLFDLRWFVLEDPVRKEKIPGETAIPAGSYKLIPAWSPTMKRIYPLLVRVPGFTDVYIHAGNTPSDTKGCLLPGKVANLDSVQYSLDALGEICAHLCAAWATKEDVILTIEDLTPGYTVV